MNSIRNISPLIFSEIEFHRLIYKYELQKKSTSLEELYDKIFRLFDKKFLEDLNSESINIENILKKYSFSFITYYDEFYPSLLKEIHDPPLILFYRGNLSILNLTYTGIVGTRKPSSISLSSTVSIVEILSKRTQIGIVSGLANGIDREAMMASLQRNIPTIGVMGTGFDKEYPTSNKDLYSQMKNSSSSLLITEMKPTEKIGKWSFPRRNRIITGIAESLIVMEAPLESGAMSSANHAITQNRDILVYDDPAQKYNEGGRKLLEEGAKLLSTKDLESNSKWLHISEILPDTPGSLAKSIALLSKLELEGKVRDRGGGYFEFYE